VHAFLKVWAVQNKVLSLFQIIQSQGDRGLVAISAINEYNLFKWFSSLLCIFILNLSSSTDNQLQSWILEIFVCKLLLWTVWAAFIWRKQKSHSFVLISKFIRFNILSCIFCNSLIVELDHQFLGHCQVWLRLNR